MKEEKHGEGEFGDYIPQPEIRDSDFNACTISFETSAVQRNNFRKDRTVTFSAPSPHLTNSSGDSQSFNQLLNTTTDSDEELKPRKYRKSLKLNAIPETDSFNCPKCVSSSEECQFCEGKSQISGAHSFVKFFEFILDFKLGNKEDY